MALSSVKNDEKTITRKLWSVSKKLLIYLLLIFITLFMLGPFIWLLSTALKSGGENIFQYPPKLIPDQVTFTNFVKVMETFPFWRYLFNSTIVTVLTVIFNVLFCSLAAYPLARMYFKGKNIIFILILSTMMIPFQLLMIPIYIMSLNLGLGNTYAGMVLPHITTAFGVFLMRQAFTVIPKELDESARIDGANSFQIWFRILMPLVKPSMVTLAIFTFISAWGDFLWPLIIVSDQDMYTLPLGLNMLSGTFTSDWRLIAAGAIISMIPVVLFFLFLQRYFISGVMKGAVKG
ncbi:putative chitobiose transport system permease protein [Virgibacillus natechei]|uniref:Chitobiose transport system permease protein n=1 Tax=Virgibacillus natechei TaxID=1216297 RepID=A0ABS4IKQ7_9BACI|nr:carbohydrate ABC transporter permease [Virgibacillus natechei]MBP1971548.1 putative chitobiose transport system permease protein [Virgibacillus natechei]UZD11982.1 carbohydrate ABC transporter permease [Virgibacillus natechei]